MAKNPLTLDQIAQGWVAEGGDPKWAVPMAKIALRESGGRVGINNRGLNKNGTVDWGLFQVNDIWRKDPVIGPMFRSGEILTQRGATKAAVRIFKVQGPRAWATYNPATDQKYLGSSFRPSRSTPPASTGGAASGSAGGSTGGGLVTADPGGGVDVSALLETLQSQRRAPAASMLQAPSFAAGPSMPAGYQALVSGGGPGPRADIGKLLSLVRTQGGGDTTTAAGGASSTGAVSNTGAPRSPSNATAGFRVPSGGSKGVANFDGKQVAAWIAPALQYARQHGWKGTVSSGYRSTQHQAQLYADFRAGRRAGPVAAPGTSNHEGTTFPRGAVDVSAAAQLADILRRSPYRTRLQWAGSKDPVHFSHPHNGGY